MALQHDIQHIGDNQNPQWWGAKQGLFINALANQYGMFTADTTWEATINQNTVFSYECWQNGATVFGNGFFDGNTTPLEGISIILGRRLRAGVPNNKDNYLQIWGNNSIRRNITLNTIITPTSQSILVYHSFAYDGVLNYSNYPTMNFEDSCKIYQQRVKDFLTEKINVVGGPVAPTDNIYPINRKIMRLNFGNIENSLPPANYYNTCVMRDFRIYTRLMIDSEVSNNYHSMTATDTTDLFLEYKMSELADFYTFGGNLYARNTGSSGNGLDNGTGYDLQLLGYAGNLPILQSIY